MNRDLVRIPYDDLAADFVHIFNRVVREKTAIVVEKKGRGLAILKPMRSALTRRRKKSAADYKAFVSAAGSWKDVDTDKLVADIRDSRKRSSRPPIKL